MHGESGPGVSPEDEGRCLRCQHCLAVCPQGAISIFGLSPADSLPIDPSALPNLDQVERLVLARRSFRRYRDVDVDPALLERLLDATAYAPTGVNCRQLVFSVVSDRTVLGRLRDQLLTSLSEASAAGRIPPEAQRVAAIVTSAWRQGRDVVFRGAPHMLIVSSPPDAPCAQQDVVIALAYFELLAQSAGLGTCWCGYIRRLLEALPDRKPAFGVREGHVYYPMLFGVPASRYARTVQRRGVATVQRLA
jgi:nitroreductase